MPAVPDVQSQTQFLSRHLKTTKEQKIMNPNKFGLYVHIPFCSQLCHYCDFAKTANFDESHKAEYIRALSHEFDFWTQKLGSRQKFSSLYFGGGTPGLLTKELDPLLDRIRPHLQTNAEITLEVNPNNVTSANGLIWKTQGFNRISMGIQTFDPTGLKAMVRDHTPEDAVKSFKTLSRHFGNINIDLIFGWPGQTPAIWEEDLTKLLDLNPQHISLYALTYEGQTPMARRTRRGVLTPASDAFYAACYSTAQEFLKSKGHQQEEVSNWYQGDFFSRHNHIYWEQDYYLGLGCGSHGFLPHLDPTQAINSDIGVRYSHTRSLAAYLKNATAIAIEDDRTEDSWMIEMISSGIRTAMGINLAKLGAYGWHFNPTQLINMAITDQLITLDRDRLQLHPHEYFRETYWADKVIECFTRHSVQK
jgi:oxygen-independent coproporphyrinogen III oxidase